MMKMFPKMFGIAALVAVIALGLAFTACGPQEVVFTFINESGYQVTVSVEGVAPFTLDALINPADDADSNTVTCSSNATWSHSPDSLVRYETSGGNVIRFKNKSLSSIAAQE
jgi:ABC-type oligopeptide transport system substrate-binding subunit